jgi:dTDP-glucose pyrophosphorylase
MRHYKEHLIHKSVTIKDSLSQLELLTTDAVLFVIDDNDTLLGSLTDGDVRRALLKNVDLNAPVADIIQPNPKYIEKDSYDLEKVIEYKKNNYKIIPIVNTDKKIINVINFRFLTSYLPLDAIIMAGGRGSRLAPLTDSTPKPLLKVGNKPIMEHNIDRLSLFGVDDFWISIKYLGEQITDYFKDGSQKNVSIQYITENEPLGTIGAVANIEGFNHEHVLVMNSDLLTNLNYEHFYLDFLKQEADISILSIPYEVEIPYAVLEMDENVVRNFKEKPTYTYYSNGGIYLIKKELIELIPKGSFFNATDLIEEVLRLNKKVISYSSATYWLDIGKHADFEKAQRDINQIQFQ